MHSNESCAFPRAAVLIATRGRGGCILRTLRSVLASPVTHLEVFVIDQNDDDETADAVRPLLADPRLRYIRTNPRGKCAALNLGMRSTQAEIVLITDDDCEPEPDWAERMIACMDSHPDAAIVFGKVVAAPYDPRAGHIPVSGIRGPRVLRRAADRGRFGGIGANMGLRREVILSLGGFDEALGPGGRLCSYEDGDMTVRALLNGCRVLETDSTSVIHNGFRSWREYRELLRRDLFGAGAAFAKYIKCGQWRTAPVGIIFFWRAIVKPALQSLIRLRRPRVAVRVVSLAAGFALGFRTPVDRRRILYRAER